MAVQSSFLVEDDENAGFTNKSQSQIVGQQKSGDIINGIPEQNLILEDPKLFMDGCADGCETDVYDPYSYRVSIVIPGYSLRHANRDYRAFAETLIRQELPAHVLAKICWVGDRQNGIENAISDLANFERAFKKYLSDKATNKSSLGTSTSNLIDALTELNNIYRPGQLLDCALDDNDENLDEKIILGQSNI